MDALNDLVWLLFCPPPCSGWLVPGPQHGKCLRTTQAGKPGQAQAQGDHDRTNSGHVYRSDSGEPIAKAIVTLRSLQRPNPQVVQTGADGAFVFRELEPGTYMVQAERTGFVPKGYGQEGAGRNSTINLSAGQTFETI